MRQEERKVKIMTPEEMMKKEIADMQASIHHLQMRVKELSEENYQMKEQLSKAVTVELYENWDNK